MRWDALFADLEGQAQALETAERAAEVDERARAESAQLRLADRLRAACGSQLRLQCAGEVTVHGSLRRVGSDWLLVDEVRGEALVASASVLTIAGLGRLSAVPLTEGVGSVVPARLGIRSVLRGIARDRSPVRLHLVGGVIIDATIDRVGADFVEVATHAAGELRRYDEVREMLVVATAALVVVRRAIAGRER
jgi:hypothetical protein